MKKLLALILTLCSVIVPFASCSSDGYPKYDADVKYNFTGLNSDQIYDTIAAVSANPSDYKDKTVAISAPHSVLYEFSTNTISSAGIYAIDPTQCCNAFYKISIPDNLPTPTIGEIVTYVGTFGTNTINATEIIRHNPVSAPAVDVDTLEFSASQLKNFIVNYQSNFASSEYNGKTIKIFGHHPNTDGYQFLLGLDSTGSSTWDIELIMAEGIVLPPQIANFVNALEITGVLTTYLEDGKEYPCIKVTGFNQVSATF